MLPTLLLIDNYDSFAHNLARYAELSGATLQIERNDKISAAKIKKQKPDGIIISPGPATPSEAGNSLDIIRKLGSTTPILGVCLGHQCIGEAYGGTTIQAAEPRHGRANMITHNNDPLFNGIPSPFEAGRYHSLICDFTNAPDLEIIAREQDTNLPMAVKHRAHPVYGVQFHPESILTPDGQKLIDNFVNIVIKIRHCEE